MFLKNLEEYQKKTGAEKIPVRYEINFISRDVKIKNHFIAFTFALTYWILFKRKFFSLFNVQGLNQTKYVPQTKINTKFSDIEGLQQAKLEIKEFVDFLKYPQIYSKLGARMPRGALLTGPPGTGKTLMAKACASEGGIAFFSISGSEFVHKYVGMGASRVRSLFQQAKLYSPSIIFIDEIDAIGKKREAMSFN